VSEWRRGSFAYIYRTAYTTWGMVLELDPSYFKSWRISFRAKKLKKCHFGDQRWLLRDKMINYRGTLIFLARAFQRLVICVSSWNYLQILWVEFNCILFDSLFFLKVFYLNIIPKKYMCLIYCNNTGHAASMYLYCVLLMLMSSFVTQMLILLNFLLSREQKGRCLVK